MLDGGRDAAALLVVLVIARNTSDSVTLFCRDMVCLQRDLAHQVQVFEWQAVAEKVETVRTSVFMLPRRSRGVGRGLRDVGFQGSQKTIFAGTTVCFSRKFG
jgi:hypothetical protein